MPALGVEFAMVVDSLRGFTSHAIYNCNIGTDLELVEVEGKKKFIDNNTGGFFIFDI